MNRGLDTRRLAKLFPGLVHVSFDSGPDDRDDFDWDGGEFPCCESSAMRGPRACTCWEPVFDLSQSENLDEDGKPIERERCCHDCAYLNGSPEKEDGYGPDLAGIASDGSFFACHQGMRRVLVYRHPDGREIPAGPGDYRPPMIGLVAFKADGSPAEWCAGWAAYRRGAA